MDIIYLQACLKDIYMIAFFNDQFLNETSVGFSIDDLSVQRGYGVFDFLNFKNHKARYLDDHLNRFMSSAKNFHLPISYNKDQIAAIIQDLIQKNGEANGALKLLLTGGPADDGYTVKEPVFLIQQLPHLEVEKNMLEKGLRLMTYNYQREFPEIKTTSYLMAIWLRPLIKEQQADEVLYVHEGELRECPRANIFIVNDKDQLLTPDKKILKGITRKHLIPLAQKKFEVFERSVSISELESAKEVFITNTTKKIVPVTFINNRKVGEGIPGHITKELIKDWDEYEKN